MKTKVIKIAAVVLIVALIAAGVARGAYAIHRQEPRTLYTDAYCTVTRAGRATIVYDGMSGREYTYTTKRVKRATDAAGAAERAKAKTTTDTDTLIIQTAGRVLIVTVKTTGATLVFA